MFSFNISACGFVLVGPKNNNNKDNVYDAVVTRFIAAKCRTAPIGCLSAK